MLYSTSQPSRCRHTSRRANQGFCRWQKQTFCSTYYYGWIANLHWQMLQQTRPLPSQLCVQGPKYRHMLCHRRWQSDLTVTICSSWGFKIVFAALFVSALQEDLSLSLDMYQQHWSRHNENKSIFRDYCLLEVQNHEKMDDHVCWASYYSQWWVKNLFTGTILNKARNNTRLYT